MMILTARGWRLFTPRDVQYNVVPGFPFAEYWLGTYESRDIPRMFTNSQATPVSVRS